MYKRILVPLDGSELSAAILAKADDVDLIAMSTHGHGGLGRLVFGSVTDHVLRHSPVPVLVMRPPE